MDNFKYEFLSRGQFEDLNFDLFLPKYQHAMRFFDKIIFAIIA